MDRKTTTAPQIERKLKKLSVRAVLVRLGVVGFSAYCGYALQPLVSSNSDAISTVVTIFSILAGFLIAVITIVADPHLGAHGSWKELQISRPLVAKRITRHKLLFYLYLIVLGSALAVFIIPDSYCLVKLWIERFFVGVSTFVFLASFTLPNSLAALTMGRYDAALDERSPDAIKRLKSRH